MDCSALILAGGLGTRLRPFSDRSPKPMLPLLGTPLLGHVVRSLDRAGIGEMTILGHHRFRQIEEHFQANRCRGGARLDLVAMDALKGTAHALTALKQPRENVLVYYGDIVLDRRFPWAQFLQAHGSSAADVTMLYKRVADARTYGVLDLRDGRITGLREKPFLGAAAAVPGEINGAVYLLGRRAVARTLELVRDVADPGNTKNDFIRNIFPRLLEGGLVFHGFDLGTGYWMSVDSPGQYRQIFLDYLDGRLELEIGRSYSEIDAEGSWGYAPFLNGLVSLIKPAAAPDPDRAALLRGLLACQR